MEASDFQTPRPDAHSISDQGILPMSASVPADNAQVKHGGQAGRSRKSRKQRAGEFSPTSARWHAWRQAHEGPLESVFQDYPEAYEIFQQAVKSAPQTLEEWQQKRVSWRPWNEWREQHRGSLHEVLADPHGWDLFCQMKARKNDPVNLSYEDWLLLPQQQLRILSAQWVAWRREHPGSEVLALMAAADSGNGAEEGWQIYRSMNELKGKSIPQTFDEWRALPEICRKASLNAWALWRHNHEGRLQDVLADPEGWKLYKEMISLNPAAAKNRPRSRFAGVDGGKEGEETGRLTPPVMLRNGVRLRKRAGNKGAAAAREARRVWVEWRGKNPGPLVHVLQDPEGWTAFHARNNRQGNYGELPATFEEWLQRPKQLSTLAKLAWTAWRVQHPGDLSEVLADPEGWTLFQEMNVKSLAVEAQAKETAGEGGKPATSKERRGGGGKATRSGRQSTPSAVPAAAITPMTTTTTTTATSAVLAGDDGNDDVELKGGVSTADEEQQQTGGACASTPGERGENRDHPLFFPETYEDWLVWRREGGRRGAERRESDALAAHKDNKKRWMRWRKEHPGRLEEVLAAEPEGWRLFSTWMGRNGERPYFSDFSSWLEVHRAEDAWVQWRQQHLGTLPAVLSRHPEGWQLYRAHAARQSINMIRKNEQQQVQTSAREHPETLEEWLQQPPQIAQLAADAWTVWRQAHPGLLREQLSASAAEEEGCGWQLLRALLQLYIPDVSPDSRKGTGVAAEVSQSQPAEQLPEKLDDFFLTSKLCSRAAWLRWSRQQGRGKLENQLRDPVGWALYKVMREGGGTAPELAATYEEWLEERNHAAIVPGNIGGGAAAGGGKSAFTNAPTGSRTAGNAAGRSADPVAAWKRWRRQYKGKLLHILQKHKNGWQLYCNMLAAKNEPVPDSIAALGEILQKQQLQKQAEAAAEWEAWRQQHRGPLEEVLAEQPQGVALYRKMVETSMNNSNHNRGGARENTPDVAAWLVWREQHPGVLEDVLAENPEATQLYCTWLAARNVGTAAGGKRRKPRGRGGKANTPEKEAMQRWRQWRAQHPGELQQVLGADLAAAAAEGGRQSLLGEGDAVTGWQLFCAYAAARGRQVCTGFEEWLKQPQQIAQREFSSWRADHPGPLIEVLKDPEGWQLFVSMKKAFAAAAAEEGGALKPTDVVVENFNEWVEKERMQREQNNRPRRNRRVAAQQSPEGGEVAVEQGLMQQAY